MFKPTALIAVLLATAAFANPLKPPLPAIVPQVGIAIPIKTPVTKTILRGYGATNCATANFVNEYDMAPSTCYLLPGLGADLKFNTCGQVTIYTDTSCSVGAVIMPHDSCYNVGSYNSIQVLGC